jgi:hypothetical protein
VRGENSLNLGPCPIEGLEGNRNFAPSELNRDRDISPYSSDEDASRRSRCRSRARLAQESRDTLERLDWLAEMNGNSTTSITLKHATVKDVCGHGAVRGFIPDEDKAVDLEELMRRAESSMPIVNERGGKGEGSSEAVPPNAAAPVAVDADADASGLRHPNKAAGTTISTGRPPTKKRLRSSLSAVRISEVEDTTGKNITQILTARDSLLASLDRPDGIRGYHNRGEPAFYITISSPAIGFAAGEETSSVAMSGLSGAGELHSQDLRGISEASEVDEAACVPDNVAGVLPTRHRQKLHSPEDMRRRNASKNAKRRAVRSENSPESRVSAGPTGLSVPEILEDGIGYLEAAASSMALEVPLGDDGQPGVVETSTATGGNSNWSSQDSASRATTFSISLASVSAAAAATQPEPSDEGMTECGVDALIAHAAAAEDNVEETAHATLHVVDNGDTLPERWGTMNSRQRKNYLSRGNKRGKQAEAATGSD